MPVSILGKDFHFPPVTNSQKDGLLAIGGGLEIERLKLAYRSGIFPWFSEGEPICWFSPDPRFIMFPEDLIVSKSMFKILQNNPFHITINRDFRSVIESCSLIKRKGQFGTWITDEMIEAYSALNRSGLAYSVEAWKNNQLAGGLYGIRIGDCFFGESMFSTESNASKAAFITLVKHTKFRIIDCQVYTDHLSSLGAKLIPREEYLSILQKGIVRPDIKLPAELIY